MATLSALAGAATGPAARYAVRIERDWAAARPGYGAAVRGGASTPFQAEIPVDSWYRAMAGRPDLEPLVVAITDGRSGAAAIHLPLVRRRVGLARVVAFADLDLADYNAPVLGPAAPRDAAGAAALFRALRAALPGTDLVDFRKMPLSVEGRPNPLALLPTLPSRLNGNAVRIGDSYEEYMRGSLKRIVRKELERSWRVFSRHPEAAFREVTGLEERRRVLAAIERQQPVRMRLAGKTYGLDAPEPAAFYRGLVEADPDGRSVALFALTAGAETVAALLGLRSGRSFTMIRIGNSADPAWTNASPGRLAIERAMAHLHADGVRDFDFSVGNYDYKRRFGVQPVPLVDLVRPLTPLGLPGAAGAHGRAWLRARPVLEARARRLLGRAPATDAAPASEARP